MERLLPLAHELGGMLIERGETLGVSESSSGGLISAALLSLPGASRFYRGGGVIYAAPAFKGLMHLTREDLGDRRSSTEPYALLLAGTIRDRVRASWGLCETGAAGPSGNPYGDAAGHTCVAVMGAHTSRSATLETGLSDRAENMHLFAERALRLLHETLASRA